MKTLKKNALKVLFIGITAFTLLSSKNYAMTTSYITEKSDAIIENYTATTTDVISAIMSYMEERGYHVYSLTQRRDGKWIADTQYAYNSLITVTTLNEGIIITAEDMPA